MPATHDAEATADRDLDECQPMASIPADLALGREIIAIQDERRELDRRMRELYEEIRTRQSLIVEMGKRDDDLRHRANSLVAVETFDPFSIAMGLSS